MSRLNKISLSLLALLATGLPAFAAEAAHEAVSAKALPLFQVGPLTVTNSMATSWVMGLLLLLVVKIAVKKPQLVPSRGQAVIESMVEILRDLLEPIIGKKAMPA